MNIRSTLPFIVCAGLAMSGCNTANSDWEKATMGNTVAAYQTFLQKHAGDKRADNARGRILALQDEQAWATAMKTHTVESFQEYTKAESGGVYADDARYQITALQRAAAWQALQNDLSAASLQAFLQKYPQGPESNEARARLNEFSYRVQLADLRSRAAAERKRAELQARFGKVLHEIVVVAPTAPDTTYRVTSGPMSEASASSTCATLERAHQSCKLVEGLGA
jgi:SPOR domain